MDELEKNKIKASAKKVIKNPVKDIKKEIKENYEIGIEYFEDVQKRQNKG